MNATRWSGWLLAAATALVLETSVAAQTPGYAVLHQFAGGTADGASPQGSLLLGGSTLYGMAPAGGSANLGVIFRINTDGTGFAILHSFAGGAADGAQPYGSLILTGSVLYGMTWGGGASELGTIFQIGTDGTGFAVLHSFAGGAADGSHPYGTLLQSGTTLYGLTSAGGSAGYGCVFKVGADGTGFSILHAFAGGLTDGANPLGSLIFSGPTLFGMTGGGGALAAGTVFRINSDGTGYGVVHSFGGSDGAQPVGSLVLSGGRLYGMTPANSTSDLGKAFVLNPDGSGFAGFGAFIVGSEDGADPRGSLTPVGATLFGMTRRGGSHDAGSVFKLTGGFAMLYAFDGSGGGSQPRGDLTPSADGATFYGMTSAGGANGLGIVFAFTPSGPLITQQPSSTQVGAGAFANFAVGVSGDATYQWQRQSAGGTTWTNLSSGGAYFSTSDRMLAVSPVSPAMNGDSFRCIVTNGFGSVTSAPATLTVVSAPVITSGPLTQTHYYVNSVESFKVDVSFTASSSGMAVDWQISRDGGATWSSGGAGSMPSANYQWAIFTTEFVINVQLSTPQEMAPTLYRCVVSNNYGTATSSSVTLSLGKAVDIVTPPASRSASAGNSAGFSVAAVGWSALTYQWQRQAAGAPAWTILSDGGSYIGAATSTLSINPVTAAMNGDSFRCVITGSYGQAFTSIAVLTVTDAVVLSASPVSQSVATGNAAAFSVSATGVPPLTYQWQRQAAGTSTWVNLTDGTGFGGTTTGTLTLNGVSAAMNGDLFRCVISNSFGTTTSSPAAVVVPVPITVTTLAGQGGISGASDGAGAAAQFNRPGDVAVDGAGNIYVADTFNDTIRKITPAGQVSTVAGYVGASGNADGPAATARFDHPAGIAADAAGNLYVADTDNDTIRKISASGTVSTLAGLAGAGGSSDGEGANARFNHPTGLAADPDGNLYIADTLNHTIRKVTPAGVVTTLAGTAGVAGSTDGLGTAARFYGPQGMALDGAGNLFVADANNSTLRRLALATGAVTTFAGLARNSGGIDAPGSLARFYYPSAVAADGAGNLYVADTDNNTLRAVSPSGLVSTIAGKANPPNTPTQTSDSSDGVGEAARFFFPSGIAADASGNLYIADTNNQTIRLAYYPSSPAFTAQPQSQTVAAGANLQFAVAVTGRPTPTLQWYCNGTAISGATGATLSLTGVQSTNAGDYKATATNPSGTATSSKATLTVTVPPPSVTAPATGTASAGGGGGGGGGGVEPWFAFALFGLLAGSAAVRHRRVSGVVGRDLQIPPR